MKQIFIAIALFYCGLLSASDGDWGRTGHRATGEVAEEYLSEDARERIAELLDGQSLAFVSTYGDDIKSDPRYRKYNPWHYVNLDPGQTAYSETTASPEGDLVQAIRTCIAVLKDEKATKEEKAFHLKLLVHFMGDLHQPLHAGRGADKGGNDIQVRWFGQGSNLHRVWDSEMIDDFQMSYTELAESADNLSEEEVERIAEGSVVDWMYESKALSQKVYDSVEIGEKLGYEYMYEWFPVVHDQIQKGGIRLARVLNDIWD